MNLPAEIFNEFTHKLALLIIFLISQNLECYLRKQSVHTRTCTNKACPFHTPCIRMRLSRNFHSKDFTLSLLCGWSMTVLPKSKQKLEEDYKMFVFSQLTMPTLSPETLGGPPLGEINMFCHFVADLGWHSLLSRVPRT